MPDLKSYPNKGNMRSKEVGLISLVTVLSQFISGNLSTRTVNEEIQKLQFEVSRIRVERAENYVNRSDFRVLNIKVDRANDQLSTLKSQTYSIKTFLKSRLQYTYSENLFKNKVYSLSENRHEYKRVN